MPALIVKEERKEKGELHSNDVQSVEREKTEQRQRGKYIHKFLGLQAQLALCGNSSTKQITSGKVNKTKLLNEALALSPLPTTWSTAEDDSGNLLSSEVERGKGGKIHTF